MTETKALTTAVKDKKGLQDIYGHIGESIAAILPKHIDPIKVLKMCIIAASRQPALYQCTIESWMQVMMRSSELGLDCSGTLGYAYVIPFRNGKTGKQEAQFMAGYKGLVDLALRSGKVLSIDAYLVREKDEFEYELGTVQKIFHKPYLGPEYAGEIIAAYAVATLRDGIKKLEVMTINEICAIRNRSKAYVDAEKKGYKSTWHTDEGQMVRKTLIRRITNYIPLSPELEKALIYDYEADGLVDKLRHTVDEADGRSRTERLKDSLKDAKPADAQVVDEPPAVTDDLKAKLKESGLVKDEPKELGGNLGPKKYERKESGKLPLE